MILLDYISICVDVYLRMSMYKEREGEERERGRGEKRGER